MARSARVLAGLVATGVLVVGVGAPAVADPMNPTTPEDALWYYTAMNLPDIHASGITGKGVTIAIIDGPIYLGVPTLQGANVEVQPTSCYDTSGVPLPGTSESWDVAHHGTGVTSLVVGTGAGYPGEVGVQGVAPDARVLYYPMYFDGDLPEGETCHDATGTNPQSVDDQAALAIDSAVANGAQIVSMSFITAGVPQLQEATATALRHGVILVAGLGNTTVEQADPAPAIFNGVVSVLSGAYDGSLQTDEFTHVANTSPFVDVVAPGVNILQQGSTASKDWTSQSFVTGTSAATPIVAGELALDMQKYPNATSNQILQAMIHNTGATGVSHEPMWDENFGYGTVSARTLLPADPTQYPDVNPFIDPSITDDDPHGPSVAEINGTTTASPTPGVTPTDPGTTVGPTPPVADSSNLAPFLLIAGIVLLLIIVVIVIIVVVAARKPRKGQTPS